MLLFLDASKAFDRVMFDTLFELFVFRCGASAAALLLSA